MKTIIAGSRSIRNLKTVIEAVEKSGFQITEVVSGNAQGLDRLGEIYASQHKIKCSLFPANWDLHGKSAGYKRNVEMAEYADALIAVWDGVSPGTKHMINIATKLGLKVYVFKSG